MEKPKVSVIIPAYHCAGTIGRAVRSALRQQVPLEILVIDDCSGDSLDQVMEEFAGEPVLFLKNEKNLGAAATRNRGVSMARGEYVAFLDADDWWEDGKLSSQLKRLEETGCVLCSTSRELVSPDGQLTGKVIPVTETITYRQMLHQNCINCSSVVLKTEVAREFPMEHEDSHEDYITWLRILKKYRTACAVNQPFLKYRLTNSGKSGSKLQSAKMTYQVYRYAGFGRLRSGWYFLCYAVNGVWKYARASCAAGRNVF
ncbi:MAG: glycosyltransferase family 2 protein [Candidatus Limivivens sp.]|nr:glycosyltransferase family 2 protein [Candidatus Limivivens sp.]